MNKFTLTLAPLLTLLLAVPTLAATSFKVDPVHSFVVFKIQHLGVGNAWGRFNDPAGTIVWDDQDPSKSRLEITLQAEKIDTGNAGRDRHLKSADFFNVKEFPKATFKSTSITKSSDNQFEMKGDLSLHGVTKPITVTLTKIGEGDRGERFGYRAGFEASFTIKRSDFGITYMPDGLGEDVTVTASLEAIRSS